MGGEEKSSFHGSLSRFAYAPPSLPPRHDHDHARERAACLPAQAASAPCSIKGRVTTSTPGRVKTETRSRKRQKLSNATSHLSGIPDCVAEDLDVLFCGINPGHMSAVTGHHYANPTNHFWHCLHLSGFTSRLLLPSEDFTLPERFDLGLVNLVDRPSTSQADLSAQEMASSVPALLTKIARFRPRVVCFIGKGIWLHVERALNLLKGSATGNQYTGSPLGAHTQGNVVHQSAKAPVTPKDGRSAYFLLDSDTPRVSIQRPLKAEPEHFLDFSEAVKPEETRSDVSYERLEDTAEATALLSSLSRSTMRRRSGMSSSKKGETPPAQAFAYGLQPFKALHDIVPHSASVTETLFCVFPSTSGRVVNHQRDDKVALFKALRDNLESIKAGTIDTGFMQTIRLPADDH